MARGAVCHFGHEMETVKSFFARKKFDFLSSSLFWKGDVSSCFHCGVSTCPDLHVWGPDGDTVRRCEKGYKERLTLVQEACQAGEKRPEEEKHLERCGEA